MPEPFNFKACRVNQAVLRISQPSPAEIIVANIHFDPYKDTNILKGSSVFLPKYQATESELENYARQLKEKVDFVVIVTDEPHRFPTHHVTHRFRIFEHTLKAVAIVSSIPEQIQDSMGEILPDVELAIDGQMETRRTANIVGILPAENSAEEIIVCAHHDSYSCPGADDNASGVSVLIELANIFGKEKQLPRTIRFVALGAEEWGTVGSRVYVKEHLPELQRTLAVINLDSVSGEGGTIRADIAGSFEEVPAIDKKTFDELTNKAFNYPKFAGGIDSALIYCDDLIPHISHVPNWLRETIEESGKELGYPIEAVKYIGSDHAIFALAAPAISIGKGDVPVHTPQDNLSAISAESLEMVTRFSEQILRRLLSIQIPISH
jgi:putative aminopeptidase FrvX